MFISQTLVPLKKNSALSDSFDIHLNSRRPFKGIGRLAPSQAVNENSPFFDATYRQ